MIAERLEMVVERQILNVFFHSSTKINYTKNVCGQKENQSLGVQLKLRNMGFTLEVMASGDIATQIVQLVLDLVTFQPYDIIDMS